MKKTKNPNGMMTTKSASRLSVFNSGVRDDKGRETVIACGYSVGTQFGYFICKEAVSSEGFVYSDVTAFYPKENEKTYSKVLEDLKRHLVNA